MLKLLRFQQNPKHEINAKFFPVGEFSPGKKPGLHQIVYDCWATSLNVKLSFARK